MHDGVSASKICLPKLQNPPATIFEFLCGHFGHIDKQVWQRRFERGEVLNMEGVPLSCTSPYGVGQVVRYYRQVDDEVAVPFHHRVIFENEHLLVVDKPHFLAMSPAGRNVKQTLLSRLKAQTGNEALSPIHRLDRDTAGLVMLCKHEKYRHLYHRLFATHDVHKVYHAIAPSLVSPPKVLNLHLERSEPFYVMRVSPDKPANTSTHIRLLQVKGEWAKYELTPTTGKLHQLRVHLNHLGAPIKDDPYYPTIRHRQADDFTNPMQLLAQSLTFKDPMSGEHYEFCSSLSLAW